MTTFYVAGPITGRRNYNRDAFTYAADSIRACGHGAINPHDIDGTTHKPWETYMRQSLSRMLLDADEIVLLPGWEQSRGARIERHLAGIVGMPVHDNLQHLLTRLDSRAKATP
jgi:hypothetical protein